MPCRRLCLTADIGRGPLRVSTGVMYDAAALQHGANLRRGSSVLLHVDATQPSIRRAGRNFRVGRLSTPRRGITLAMVSKQAIRCGLADLCDMQEGAQSSSIPLLGEDASRRG
jgi:hypothetical protein